MKVLDVATFEVMGFRSSNVTNQRKTIPLLSLVQIPSSSLLVLLNWKPLFIHYHGYPVITILNPRSLPTRDNYCTVWEKENVHWITMRVSRFGSKHTLVIQFVHYWIPCSTLISSNVLLPRILEISSMLVTIRVTSDFCYKICNLFTDL